MIDKPSVSIYKRLMSYLYPIRLKKGSSVYNAHLELCLYQNEYQLATKDAIYSDGIKYRPLLIGFDGIGERIKDFKNVLFLGAGIGSGVQILAHKGLYPKCVLVDIDSVILDWAKEILTTDNRIDITTVAADVETYVFDIDAFDMVVVDVFIDRVVPAFVLQEEFLLKCAKALNTNGYFIMNYIMQNESEYQNLSKNLAKTFRDVNCISNDINRVFIATV